MHKTVLKNSLAIIALSILGGCATSKIDWSKSAVVNELPKNIQGTTVSLFPLDKDKSSKIETSAIENHLSNLLTQKGIKPINPRYEVPKYFLLYDYASDYGISSSYEHAVLIIVYALEKTPRQVYKAKLIINSEKNDTIESSKKAISELLSTLPDASK
jgi:lipase chaperone LimK